MIWKDPREDAPKGVRYGRECLQVARHALLRLHRHHTLRVQPPPEQAIKALGIQERRRARLLGVWQVHNDYVVGILGVLQVFPGVCEVKLYARVIEGAAMVVGEKSPADFHHLAVQVHHHRRLHRVVGQDLPQRLPPPRHLQ